MMTTEEFIDELKRSLGDNLISAVMYGSSVTGDATLKFSNVNIFLLLKDAGIDALRSAMPAARKWFKQGHPVPLFFSEKDFRESNDVFAIEFSDIKANHKVLHGSDPFAYLKIDSSDLRKQLEFELRSKYIQLRQRYIEVEDRPKEIKILMAKSLSSFSVLFKSALQLIGETVPTKKMDAWKALARHAAIDVPALEKIWMTRHGNSLPDRDVNAVFLAYLKSVETVIEFVDKK